MPEFQFIGEADPKLKVAPQRADLDDTIAPAWWLDKIPDSPVKRILSKGSNYGKSIITQLVEHPFVQNRHLGPNPASSSVGVDRLVAMEWTAPMVATMKDTEALYLRYRKRVSDSKATTMTGQFIRDIGNKKDALGFDEFLEEIGKHKGGRGATHDIQEIVEASNLWHEQIYKRNGNLRKKQEMMQTLI